MSVSLGCLDEGLGRRAQRVLTLGYLGMATDDGCATMRSAARQPRRFWLAHRWSIGSCASPSEVGVGRDFSQTTSFSPAAGSTAVRGTGRIFHQLAGLSAVVKRH